MFVFDLQSSAGTAESVQNCSETLEEILPRFYNCWETGRWSGTVGLLG